MSAELRAPASRAAQEDGVTQAKLRALGWAFTDEPIISKLGLALLHDDTLTAEDRALIRLGVAAVIRRVTERTR